MSAFDEILKLYYLGPVREQLNNKRVLLKRMRRDNKSISGKYAEIPIHIKRNATVGARADAKALPAASKQTYDNARVKMKYQYGRIQVTGPTIAASRNDRGAFLKAVDSELSGVTKDLQQDINRQLFGDGTGRLCKISNTITSCNTALTVTTMGASGPNWKHPENIIWDNMPINVLDTSGYTTYHAATGATACMLANNPTSSTSLKWDQDTAITSTGSGDYVTKNLCGFDGGTTGSCVEIMGLRAHVDDGNLFAATGTGSTGLFVQNIDAGSTKAVSAWRAKVIENPSSAGTARSLNLDIMQEAFDNVEIKNGGDVTLILTTAGIRRKYLDLLRADRRFVKEMTLDGGFKAVDYNGSPLVVDIHATNYDMYFLDESTFAIYNMSDIDWMDKDGAVLCRVSGYDAYEATLFWYLELGCSARNKNCRLTDINETAL